MHCYANPFIISYNHYGHCCHHHHHCNNGGFGNAMGFLMLTSMLSGRFRRPQYNENYQYQIQNYNDYYNFNYYYPQVYPVPVFVPSQSVMPQMVMPSLPEINYAEIFENNYNNLIGGNSNHTQTAPSYPPAPSSSVDTGKLDKNVLNRIKQMAQNLNCDYKDLLALINSESGFNPKAQNGGAVGLIQFTGVAREELKRVYGINVTKEQILNMSIMQQLDLAEKYLRVAKSYTFGANDRLSGADLYAITFLPGRANREVLCVKGERDKNGKLLGYYEQNPMDENNDGRLTKSDLQARLNKKRVNESIFA